MFICITTVEIKLYSTFLHSGLYFQKVSVITINITLFDELKLS